MQSMVPVHTFWHLPDTHAALHDPAASVASVVPRSQPQSSWVVQLFVHTMASPTFTHCPPGTPWKPVHSLLLLQP